MSGRRFLTIELAAESCSVSKDTIRRAIKAGLLQAKRTGRNGGGPHLIRVEDLDAWFDRLEDA